MIAIPSQLKTIHKRCLNDIETIHTRYRFNAYKQYIITIAMSPSKQYRFLSRKTISKRWCKRYRNDATTIDYFLPGR